MADIEQNVILKVGTNEAITSIKDLRNNVNVYKNDLAKLKVGTDEYNKTLKKLAESQNKINEINKNARASTLNLTDAFSQLSTVASGVTAGFGAVSSAVALLGEDNEALVETLVKVQAGLALTQQLSSLARGIKAADLAFRAFNSTLYANPILAVVAGITALVAITARWIYTLSEQNSGVKELNESYEEQKKHIEETNKLRDREIDILKVQGTTILEITEIRRRQIQSDIEAAKIEVSNRQAEIDALDSKFKFWFSSERKRLKALQEIQKEESQRLETLLDSLDKLNHQYTVETIKEDKSRSDQLARQQEESNKKRFAEQEKYREQEEKAEKSFSNIIVNIEQERQKRITDAYQGQDRIDFLNQELLYNEIRQEQLLKDSQNEVLSWQEREKAAKEYQNTIREEFSILNEISTLQDKLSKEDEERIQRSIEFQQKLNEIQNPDGRSQEEILQERIDLLWNEVENEELSYERRIKAIDEYNKALQESKNLEEKLIKEKERLRQAELKSYATILAQSSNLIGENTVAGKTLAVAGATINTYLAGTVALSSYPPPVSYIALASTIATGLATVKNILATKVPGTSDTTSTSSTPSLPSFPEMNTGFIETHNNLDAYDEDIFNQQPVLVVEDFNRVQNRVYVAEDESTF